MMKKRKLTKEEALQYCYDLWSWLAENPTKGKRDWPGWKKNGGEFQARLACFACEFRYQHGLTCTECILPCFASLGGSISCLEDSSPYSYWDAERSNRSYRGYDLESIEIRKRNAELIRDSAAAALSTLRREKR